MPSSSSQTLNLASIQPLLGLPPFHPSITSFLQSRLVNSSSSTTSSSSVSSPPCTLPQPDIKIYSDAIYHNYYLLSLSLYFITSSSNSSPKLDAIDIYNPFISSSTSSSSSTQSNQSRSFKKIEYAPPPLLKLNLSTNYLILPPQKSGESSIRLDRDPRLMISRETKGRDLVRSLGEPTRKGGGSGWVGVWLEWNDLQVHLEPMEEESEKENGQDGKIVKLGLLVELRDPKGNEKLDQEAKRKGAGGVWERAAGWEWANIKVFA